MTDYETPRAMRMLPQVLVATTAVLLVPVGLVWWLRAAGLLTSYWACVAAAVALSVVVSGAASSYWKRRDRYEGVVFSELLLWGWVRRLRGERQLAHVARLLQHAPGDGALRTGGVSTEERAELLQDLAAALDAQDPYTDGHSRRVARHAAMTARLLHLPDDQVRRIRLAGAVHDVGKLRVRPALLTKPGALTSEEFEIVKRHAAEGAALVAGLGDPELEAIVRHHHERFDGTGYPAGLRGTDIPLGARIVAVADTFDAITSVRPYRGSARHKRALDILIQAAGTQLDPAAVRAFLRYYSGRKGSVVWAVLAVLPQRLVAWMHGELRAAGNVSYGQLAATSGTLFTVGLAAMGAAAFTGITHAASTRPSTPSQLAALGGGAGAGGATRAGAPAGASGGGLSAGGTSFAAAGAGNTPGGPSLSPQPGGSVVHFPARGVGTTHAQPTSGGGGPGVGTPGAPGAPPAGRHKSGGGSGAGPPGSGPGGSSPQLAAPVSVPSAPPTPAPSIPVSSSAPVQTAGGSSGPPTIVGTGTPGPGTPGPGTPGPGPPPTVAPGGGPTGSPQGPTSKDQCKNGGYEGFGFKNQGQCIASVVSH